MSISVPEGSKSSESKPKEIECKFVIESLSPELKLDELEGTRIDQGYLAVDDHAAVRVRRKGPNCYITFKAASTTHVAERVELETELTEKQFVT